MFERIKCYRKLKRAEKLMLGAIKIGEILNDDELAREANEALKLNKVMMKRMMFNRKMAKEHNLGFEKAGFK